MIYKNTVQIQNVYVLDHKGTIAFIMIFKKFIKTKIH